MNNISKKESEFVALQRVSRELRKQLIQAKDPTLLAESITQGVMQAVNQCNNTPLARFEQAISTIKMPLSSEEHLFMALSAAIEQYGQGLSKLEIQKELEAALQKDLQI